MHWLQDLGSHTAVYESRVKRMKKLECGPMPNVMITTPTTRCHAVTLPRRESRWILQGCLKLPDRSQPLVGQSSPYSGDLWRTYLCLTSFLPIVDTCLSCEDIARQSCAMVRRWRFLATFLRPVFSARCMQHVSDLHSKFALRPHRVWKYGRHPISDRWD